MRSSLSLPSRSTKELAETFSSESSFAAERKGTGSTPGSSRTSLASPRMVVVQGDQGPAETRDRRISRHDDDGTPSDVWELAPPDVTTTRKVHEAAAASWNDSRSPHSSSPSSGVVS